VQKRVKTKINVRFNGFSPKNLQHYISA